MSLIAFVVGPIEEFRIQGDTTFALMLEAQRRGIRVAHVLPKDVGMHGDTVMLRARELRVRDQVGAHFEVTGDLTLCAHDCAAIFVRTDPPFDTSYLWVTWMLSFAERQGVRVVNSAAGIRSANEKLYALRFPALVPETLVTSHAEAVRGFLATHGGDIIVKPVDGHGGSRVLRLRQSDSNVHALIEWMTRDGQEQILVQRFLPEVADGDKRLFLIDGTLVGGVLRVPRAGDHRSNVHVGGTVRVCELDDGDRAIADALGPALRADGLVFVGIDVVGGKLLEVNVTSPTLIRELRRLGGPDLAAQLFDVIERGA